jgi:hypothetical protein
MPPKLRTRPIVSTRRERPRRTRGSAVTVLRTAHASNVSERESAGLLQHRAQRYYDIRTPSPPLHVEIMHANVECVSLDST